MNATHIDIEVDGDLVQEFSRGQSDIRVAEFIAVELAPMLMASIKLIRSEGKMPGRVCGLVIVEARDA